MFIDLSIPFISCIGYCDKHWTSEFPHCLKEDCSLKDLKIPTEAMLTQNNRTKKASR